MFKKIRKNFFYGAFFLYEALLAVLVVSLGIIGFLSLASKNMSQSFDSRNQVIAGFLAQEGLEIVRNIRDNNWADSDPATTSFTNIDVYPNAQIDFKGIIADFADGNGKLFQSANGLYCHNPNCVAPLTSTPFSRKLIIDDSDSNNLKVTCVVIWGNSWPGSPVSSANCNTGNKCSYAIMDLKKWGE